MGDFVKVARLAEIQPGQRKSFWVEEIRVLVYNVDGTIYASDESCPHRECSLEPGRLAGNVISCPCHAAQYSLETGKVLIEPTKWPPSSPLPIHKVKVEGEDILVALSTDIDFI